MIGYAFEAIAPDAHFHTRLPLRRHQPRLRPREGLRPVPAAGDTFKGTRQDNGDVCTRNCVAIVKSKDLIGCAARS